jgi:acetone carboxylase gamma subunit
MSDGSTYRINQSTIPRGTRCACGHTIEAHGSNGMICAACHCRRFTELLDEKEPKGAKSIP